MNGQCPREIFFTTSNTFYSKVIHSRHLHAVSYIQPVAAGKATKFSDILDIMCSKLRYAGNDVVMLVVILWP